jgi:putative flippase GtrA
VRFNLTIGAVSIVGNVVLMRVMMGSGHLNYLVANGIAIALCSVVNFLVSDGVVFQERSTEL